MSNVFVFDRKAGRAEDAELIFVKFLNRYGEQMAMWHLYAANQLLEKGPSNALSVLTRSTTQFLSTPSQVNLSQQIQIYQAGCISFGNLNQEPHNIEVTRAVYRTLLKIENQSCDLVFKTGESPPLT